MEAGVSPNPDWGTLDKGRVKWRVAQGEREGARSLEERGPVRHLSLP